MELYLLNAVACERSESTDDTTSVKVATVGAVTQLITL